MWLYTVQFTMGKVRVKAKEHKASDTGACGNFKDVRANCFCASLTAHVIHVATSHHVMHRAHVLREHFKQI